MEPLKAVFALSARLLLLSRKTIFMALLSALGVALALLTAAVIQLRMGGTPLTGFGQVSELMSLVYLYFLVVVTLFYATSLIGDEVDEKTLTYLFVRPVRRGVVYLGKFLAAVMVAFVLIVPSASLAFLILTSIDPAEEALGHLPVILKDVGILSLGALAYSALFGFLGVAVKRPLVVGLLFSMGWESVVTYIPGFIHKLTVMHYLQSLLPHPSGQRGILSLFQQATPAPASIATLLAIAAGFVALAFWTVSRKEYVLES
jgi:ABC-type transport system involved in multi-copper enzyme maturation permease subunit